jgi:hypothetical protein
VRALLLALPLARSLTQYRVQGNPVVSDAASSGGHRWFRKQLTQRCNHPLAPRTPPPPRTACARACTPLRTHRARVLCARPRTASASARCSLLAARAQLLGSNPFWRDYDFVWFPDDDLEVSVADINLMFATCADRNLCLAQPSLKDDPRYPVSVYVTHDRLVQKKNDARFPPPLRYTNFVELQVKDNTKSALWYWEFCSARAVAQTQSSWLSPWAVIFRRVPDVCKLSSLLLAPTGARVSRGRPGARHSAYLRGPQG